MREDFTHAFCDVIPRFHEFFHLFPWLSSLTTPNWKDVLAAIAPSLRGKQAGLIFPTGAFVFPDPGFPVAKGS